MNYFTGNALKAKISADKKLRKIDDRHAVRELRTYLCTEPDGTIMCINGAGYTGKTTLLLRAIMSWNDYENTGYVDFSETDRHFGCEHNDIFLNNRLLFIDNADKCGDITDLVSKLLDAAEGKDRYIVFTDCGTLASLAGGASELNERIRYVDINYMPIKEYTFVFDKDKESYYRYGGIPEGEIIFSDMDRCRPYICHAVKDLMLADPFFESQARKKESTGYFTALSRTAETACEVLEYYAGVTVGDVLHRCGDEMIGSFIAVNKLSAEWDEYTGKKASLLNGYKPDIVSTAVRLLSNAGFISQTFDERGAKTSFTQPGMFMCICREIFLDFTLMGYLKGFPSDMICALRDAVLDIVKDEVYQTLELLLKKNKYHCIIKIKGSTPPEEVGGVQIEAESAFSNRAGEVKNISDEPGVLIYCGNREELDCLRLGITFLKEDTCFLYYIDSFQWINTADPSESEDILESLRMCTAV